MLPIAGDNKFLCVVSGHVSGTGRCRGYYAEPLPIGLMTRAKYITLES